MTAARPANPAAPISVAPDPVAPVARDVRLTTILLVARLSTDARDDLCRVRDVSSTGMRIETLYPMAVGEHVCVELKNGTAVHGVAVWVDGKSVGMRFDQPVEIVALLATPGPLARARDVRLLKAPRLSARCPVVVRRDGHIQAGVLEDISQGGARLALQGPAKVDDHVILFVPGLDSRRAMVRSVASGTIGLCFDETLAFADLAQWLAGSQRFSPNHQSS